MSAPFSEASPSPSAPEEMALDPHTAPSSQIEAFLRDPDNDRPNMAGLIIEGSDLRYRVIDARTKLIEKPETERKVRPELAQRIGRRFTPQLFEHVPTGKIDRSKEESVLVEIYDKQRDVTRVANFKSSDFYEKVDQAGSTRVFWEPTDPEPTAHAPDIAIDLTHNRDKGETAFDKITEQLQGRAIANLTGLTWRQGGHTRKIVGDTMVKIRTMSNWTWVRTFSVVDIAPNGSETYLNQNEDYPHGFRDYELAKFFADQKGGPIQDMRMPQKEESMRLDPELRSSREETRSRELYRYFGHLAARSGIHHDRDTLREPSASEFEEMIANETDSPLLKDVSPEDKTTLWLLSYPEIQASHERLRKMEEMQKERFAQPSTSRREALKVALQNQGILRVFSLALQLQHELNASLHRLNIAVQPNGQSQSLSWIMEGIADSMQKGDPFEDSVEARKLQLAMIDERVGKLIMEATTVKKKMPDVYLKDGEQKFREKTQLIFDEKHPLFREYKAVDTKDEKDRTTPKAELHRPLREEARRLYEKMAKDKEVTEEEWAHFGRNARARIGQ